MLATFNVSALRPMTREPSEVPCCFAKGLFRRPDENCFRISRCYEGIPTLVLCSLDAHASKKGQARHFWGNGHKFDNLAFPEDLGTLGRETPHWGPPSPNPTQPPQNS